MAAVIASTTACGGGAKNTPSTEIGAPSPAPVIAAACIAGSHTDYQVGPGVGQIPSIDQVPWESLTAGDTVRIFYQSTPYRGKFMLSAKGTAQAPVRICGVKSAEGLRPIIDGQNAITRLGQSYGDPLHESRSVIVIKPLQSEAWTAYPSYIQVDGLEIRGATPANTFTDTHGVSQNYVSFGACIWVDRGHNITIADNVIHDCTNGMFSKSTDDGDFAVTKNLRIAGNYVYGNGVNGDDHEHNSYMQSVGITYEFNHYGPLRSGAIGSALKDRSVGTVIRNNFIEDGAHSLDLVESEDFSVTATADPAYRKTYVYGNIIAKDGSTGSSIHYGGDHFGSTPGSSWGEPIFRKGTLYFWHNTLYLSGSNTAAIFQISTTEESAEIWNNVFAFAPTVLYPSLRVQQRDVGASWTEGGTVNLGVNWISSNWADADPWHPVGGLVTGTGNLLTGSTLPISSSTFAPLAASAAINTAQDNLPAVSAYPLSHQMPTTAAPAVRTTSGSKPDLGALEY